MTPGLATALWEHQQRMLDFALARKNVMFAAEMGTGKSLATIALIAAREHRQVLIACPLSVVGSWENQFAQHARFRYYLARCDRGGVKDKMAHAEVTRQAAVADPGSALVVVVNYESLWRAPFGDWALRAGFDLVVCDESHRTKAPTGKLSRYVKQIGRKTPCRLALTGTPFAHSPLSIFAQFRFVEHGIFGNAFTPFRQRYAVMGGFEGRQVVGYQNLDELQEKFHSRAIVITKEEALPDLPPQVFTERVTQLGPQARRLYTTLNREFYAGLDSGEVTAGNALVKLLRLQQLTSGHLSLDDGTSQWISDHKKTLLADTLEDLGEPVVVFARFTRDLDVIREVAEQFGRTYGEVSGRRKDLTSTAEMPADIDVLGVNIQAGGVGVNLSRAAVSIWYSMGYSLADYEQALARLHRPGQTQHVTHIHLITEGTVDRAVRRALAARKQVIDFIVAQPAPLFS